MIPARRAWRNPAGSVLGRCRCPVCGPVLAPAGRWQAGWLGVGWGRVRGLGGRWWPLVAGGGRVGLCWWGGCAIRARARTRVIYTASHDTVIYKNFSETSQKFYKILLKNFTKTYSLPCRDNRTKPEDCSYGIRTKSEKVKTPKVNDNVVICPCERLTPLSDTTTHGTVC